MKVGQWYRCIKQHWGLFEPHAAGTKFFVMAGDARELLIRLCDGSHEWWFDVKPSDFNSI